MDSSKSTSVVVLDAGHGGTTKVLASSPDNAIGAAGTHEKDLNLDIAARVARLLSNRAQVFLTRESDVNLSLSDRAAVARAHNADVFLSIHFNGYRDPAVDGTEVWLARNANAASAQLGDAVLRNLVQVSGVANRGLRRADLGQLLPARHAQNTAAVLAEVAFLTNPDEERRLSTDAYRQRLAQALSDGILERLSPTAAQSLGLGSLLAERLMDYFRNTTSNEIPLDPGVGGRSIDESALRIGDIIVSTTDHASSRGIRFGTGSLVSHAKLYIGGGQIVEAIGQGVVLRSLEDSLADDTLAVAFRYPGITDEQALRVRDFAGRQLDRPYNYLGIVRQAAFQIEASNCDVLPGALQSRCRNWVGQIVLGPGNTDTFFCSELVLSAYRDAGIPLTVNDPAWSTPQDIVELRLAAHLAYVGHLKAPPASSEAVSLAANGHLAHLPDGNQRALAAAIGGFGAPPARFASRALDTTALGWGVPGGRITQGYFRNGAERESLSGVKGGGPHLGIDVSQSNDHGGGADDARRGLPVYLAPRSFIPIKELNNVRVIDNGTLRTGLGLDAPENSAADLVDAVVHVQPWKPGEGMAYGGVVGIECHYTYGHADTPPGPTFTLYIEFLHLITPDYLPHDGDNHIISESAWAATGKGIGFGPRMVDGAVLGHDELTGEPLLVGYLGATSFPHVHIQVGFALNRVSYIRNPRVDPTIMLKPSSSVTVSQALGIPSLTFNDQSFTYDVPGIVPPLAQPSDNTCWATAATMMVCWRRNQSMSLQAVCDLAGAQYRSKLDRDEGLFQSEKADFLQRLGLQAEAPANYLPQGLLDLLKTYGPLWITTDEGYSSGQVLIHARLLIGMYGDGSIDGTRMVFIDPADGQRHEQSFQTFQQSFEQVAFDVRRDEPLWIQVVHNARRAPSLGQALDSVPPLRRRNGLDEVTADITGTAAYGFMRELEQQLYGNDPANPDPNHPLDLDRVADILERSLYGEADFQRRLSVGGSPIRGLRNSVIYKSGNVLIFKAKASTDTDGRVDPHTDPDHLADTSYRVTTPAGARVSLSGMDDNYFVLNSDVVNESGARTGDFGLVRNNSNRTVGAAVFGDFQPGHSAGEISFALANNLGYGLDPATAGHVDADANDTPGATYIVFVGSTHARGVNDVSDAALANEAQALLREQLRSYMFHLGVRAQKEASGVAGVGPPIA